MSSSFSIKRVLVVDDEENIRHMLGTVLRQEGLTVALADSADRAVAALEQASFDLMLTDIRMPGRSGLELLAEAKRTRPDMIVLMMSAYGTVETAIEAIQQGAHDYIAKPFKPAEIVLLLRKVEERERLRQENQQLRQHIRQLAAPVFDRFVARSAVMNDTLRTVRKIAEFKTTVLIQGESGTGKELVARALHECSPRASGPFVPINCGAIPEALLESELFGHRKGAFTDAKSDSKGLFVEANEGTLFLDEIGELPQPLQVKLLRVLQEQEVRAVGATKSAPIDVRVVAATVRDLQADVDSGRFRHDLFYRLNVLPITLPPLRERSEDIPPLVEHFIALTNSRLGTAIHGIEPDALKLLLAYSWPGNVRELENIIERAMVLAEGDRVEVSALPDVLRQPSQRLLDGLSEDELSIKKTTRAIEEVLIRRALERTGGNRTAAAKLLEISHRALLYKIKQYGIAS